MYKLNNILSKLNTKTTEVLPKVPTLLTSAFGVSAITSGTCVTGGNVTWDGNLAITERGFAYGTGSTPTIANSKKIVTGTTGSYLGTLTGLTNGSIYYVRPYATNAKGTGYGTQVNFKAQGVPTISFTLKAASAYALTHQAYGNGVWLGVADRGCANPSYVIKSVDWGANWTALGSTSVSSDSCGYMPENNCWYWHNRCNEGSVNVWTNTNAGNTDTWTGKRLSYSYHYATWKCGAFNATAVYNQYWGYTRDGVNWTYRTSFQPQYLSYNKRNGLYYVGRSGGATAWMTELNGLNQADLAGMPNTFWIRSGDNETIGFVYNTTEATQYKRDTTDGKTFGSSYTFPFAFNAIVGMEYYKGLWFMFYNVTADLTRHIAISADGGINWTEVACPANTPAFNGGNGNPAFGYNSATNTHYLMMNAGTNMLIGTFTL